MIRQMFDAKKGGYMGILWLTKNGSNKQKMDLTILTIKHIDVLHGVYCANRIVIGILEPYNKKKDARKRPKITSE